MADNLQRDAKMDEDWKPDEIIRALQLKGVSISDLASKAGTSQERIDYHKLESLIAEVLEIPVSELWPSRYES